MDIEKLKGLPIVRYTPRRGGEFIIEVDNTVYFKEINPEVFQLKDESVPSVYLGDTKEFYLSTDPINFLQDIADKKTSILARKLLPKQYQDKTFILKERNDLVSGIIKKLNRDNIFFETGNNFYKELIYSGYLELFEKRRFSTEKLLLILHKLNILDVFKNKILIKDLAYILNLPDSRYREILVSLNKLKDEEILDFKINNPESKSKEISFEFTYKFRENFTKSNY
jgi:hypothetical protein